MITKSPSGALSPYYYKGGYFHGIHYGSYFDNFDELLSMMEKEENFILASPERRKILMDFYETNLTETLIKNIVEHIERINSRIVKLAISSDRRSLHKLRKVMKKNGVLKEGQIYFNTDMEEAKTWLVSE